MRPLAWLLLVSSVVPAAAETRLDLTPIPELAVLEPVFPLDHGEPGLHRPVRGSITLGLGEDVMTSAVLAAGVRSDHVTVAASSELMSSGDALLRGRHRGLLGLSLGEADDEDFGVRLELAPSLDHGEAAGLAPVALGTGRRDTAALRGRALVQLTEEHDDFVLAVAVDGEAGVSRRDGLDRALRRSAGLGFGRVPVDGELPRGMLSMLHGRVEHVAIARAARATAAGDLPLAGDAEVRIVELGIGPRDMTFHIDRDALAVLDIDLGWSWLEADTGRAEPTLADNMLRMKWSAALVTTDGPRDRERTLRSRSQVGLSFGRQPTHTPDGQRLISEWRVALGASTERPRYVFDARGGISWASVMADHLPGRGMLVRYGTQLEAFAKLGFGIEGGGYYATWFEPPAGDLWAAERRWSTEAGVALRLRLDPLARARRPRHADDEHEYGRRCGHAIHQRHLEEERSRHEAEEPEPEPEPARVRAVPANLFAPHPDEIVD